MADAMSSMVKRFNSAKYSAIVDRPCAAMRAPKNSALSALISLAAVISGAAIRPAAPSGIFDPMSGCAGSQTSAAYRSSAATARGPR